MHCSHFKVLEEKAQKLLWLIRQYETTGAGLLQVFFFLSYAFFFWWDLCILKTCNILERSNNKFWSAKEVYNLVASRCVKSWTRGTHTPGGTTTATPPRLTLVWHCQEAGGESFYRQRSKYTVVLKCTVVCMMYCCAVFFNANHCVIICLPLFWQS